MTLLVALLYLLLLINWKIQTNSRFCYFIMKLDIYNMYFLCFQAHDSPVRTMVWSHNDSWMVTGDHAGFVKYWQSNMNNVKVFQAHKEALRGIRYLLLLFILLRFVYFSRTVVLQIKKNEKYSASPPPPTYDSAIRF